MQHNAAMDTIIKFLSALRVFWPPHAIRIIVRGSQEVAAFRALHDREPTEQERSEIANRVGEEVTGLRPPHE
jgi:hypothetical protein